MKKTITVPELPVVLTEHLCEELGIMSGRHRQLTSPYRTVEAFASITRRFIWDHDFKSVKTCFRIADNLFRDGNQQVKFLLSDAYLHALAYFLDTHNQLSEVLHYLLTTSLEKAYRQRADFAQAG